MTATHDLFVSYRWADSAAIEALVAALDARDVRVWRDAREVEDLASIQSAVATGLSGARALLAWYSGRYNESRACQWELTSAYTAAQAEGDPRLRILVVNPEASNAHVHLPELFDQLHLSGAGVPGDTAAVQALAEHIEKVLSGIPTTPLGALRSLTPPLWLPAMATGSNRFVGRLREMWQLHGALQAGQAAMLTGTGGKAGMALVRGAGGSGKSLMAQEYALRFGAAYPGGVFWLRAFGYPDGGAEVDPSQRMSLRDAQMLDIAARLGIDTSNLNPAAVRGALTRHVGRRGEPFLWIVDDLPPDPGVEGLGGWQAPHPLGCTLFTTRTRRFGHVSTIELPQLDTDDAIGLLTRKRALSGVDRDTAGAVCGLLGHHALAVDVTAALVDRRGLSAVRDALESPGRDALALAAQFDEALPSGHQRHIAATFLASIVQLEEAARELLRCAAVLAVAPVPRQLLVNAFVAFVKTTGVDPADADDQVDLAVSQLLSNSLADDAGSGAISIHTLVSRTVRFADPSPEAWDAVRGRIVEVLDSEMVHAADIRRHSDLAPWVTHARYLSKSPADVASTDLLRWVSRFDLERASYSLARQGFERELEVRRRMQGDEHPDTLTAMSNLAATLFAQRDLPGARRLEEVALEAKKRVLGEEHPSTLMSMGNLATTLSVQGDLTGARRLEIATLEAKTRVLGEEHPDTLTAMSNLAQTLLQQNELASAIELQTAAMNLARRVLGGEHPVTLTAMSNLAAMLANADDVDDLFGAKRLQEAVLEVRTRVLGEEHPETLDAMSNLATTLSGRGDLVGARRLQEAELEARRRVLGEEHPETLESMSHLASTIYLQGDLPNAGRLLEAVMDARRRVLGDEHPDTLTSMSDLAVTLWKQGDLTAALGLQQEALMGRVKVRGADHYETLEAKENLRQMQGPALPSSGERRPARLAEPRAHHNDQRHCRYADRDHLACP